MLIAVVAVWAVVVAGLAVWSVRHSAATVPEQRTIGQAMPELREAAGAVYAAAAGPGRVVVLGALRVVDGCRVTPVRHGVSVTRDVTVHVRAGEQRGDLEAIAAALPARYAVQLTPSQGGTHFSLHADAGNFIGIDLTTDVGEPSFDLRLSTGCRPVGAGGLDRADPVGGSAPAALGVALTALEAGTPSAAPSASPSVQTVRCPAGTTAGTYTVDVPAVKDWAARLHRVATGIAVVRSDTTRWAYRSGDDSVVVADQGDRLRVSASTPC